MRRSVALAIALSTAGGLVSLASCGARTGLDLGAGAGGGASAGTAPGTVISNILSISAGRSHTCALRTDGTVVCWGNDEAGQLGNGTVNLLTNDPVVVSGLNDAVAVAAGPDYTCAVHAGGGLSCWGSDQLGQYTSVKAVPTPTPVDDVGGLRAVSAATRSVAGLGTDGTVSWWSALTGTVHPQPVPALAGATEIAATDFGGVYGLLPGGTVLSAFAGADCADGGCTMQVPSGASSFSVSPSSGAPGPGCALLSGGAVACWGDTFGSDLSVVAGLPPATAVSTNNGHTCVLLADTTVRCWGDNTFGQLGDGTTFASDTPVVVQGLSGVVAISAGWFHTCAVLSDQTGACWGNNQLRVPDGGITNAPAPVTVTF